MISININRDNINVIFARKMYHILQKIKFAEIILVSISVIKISSILQNLKRDSNVAKILNKSEIFYF